MSIPYKVYSKLDIDCKGFCIEYDQKRNLKARARFGNLAKDLTTIGAVKIEGIPYYFGFTGKGQLIYKRKDNGVINDIMYISCKLAGTKTQQDIARESGADTFFGIMKDSKGNDSYMVEEFN